MYDNPEKVSMPPQKSVIDKARKILSEEKLSRIPCRVIRIITFKIYYFSCSAPGKSSRCTIDSGCESTKNYLPFIPISGLRRNQPA